MTPVSDDVQQAIRLARQLQRRACELQTSSERRQQAEFDRMIQSPGDKATLTEITDQAFRAERSGRAVDQLIHILDVQGVPRFFSTLDRTMLRGFQTFGGYLPGVALPLVKDKMREETANVILPAEDDLLAQHLEERRQEGVRMNVNYLGESLLGEREAQRRLQKYLAALQQPEIEVISVKISTIYSQISALARAHAVDVLCDRLELLYRAAAKGRFQRADGAAAPKFVYLDMEEYRDKELTAEAFMRTLERPGLESAAAGIALQAYIPDSFATLRAITEWARNRVSRGGAPITVRLVKGANMEMERVEASLRGWPLATFADKRDTDANYHRMLRYALQPDNLAAVRVGVASHNLFTLAYAMVLAAASDPSRPHPPSEPERPRPPSEPGRPRPRPTDHVQFEMLEGMANHQRRALFEHAGNLLLYAPACRQEEFINAIGYLVRRLDENTGPDNYLRYAFNLQVDSPVWRRLEEGFVESFARIDALPDEPRRRQNRAHEAETPASRDQACHRGSASSRRTWSRLSRDEPLHNEPDTDWSLPHNGAWATALLDRWRPRCGEAAADVPLVIVGEERFDGAARASLDPSRPGVTVANFRLATAEHVDAAVTCAAADPDGWRRRDPRERTEILFRAAEELVRRRGDLLGAMTAEGGKTLAEGDPEVSEAVDFCRFYAASAERVYADPAIEARGRGVVVVVSPWNFPLAIPCGGVAAALAAGNTVILKPASDTVLIAYLLCECFWAAGVPRTALQFAPCPGATVGQTLVSHAAVDAVVLTGGTATAQEMLRRHPAMRLLAETGGKNATIVTALADRELAIKNVLHSAFSHSGQKCSATSLLVLEDEVYHDARFRETLVDAVESLHVGSAWELPTKVSPLIRPPSGELERALKELEPGESWAVMPRLHVDGNPRLVSPGVKWGVQPGSVTHLTEFFGPVLGVMRARDLPHAVDLVNATGYGLTSGLESLDDREHERWKAGVRAGNLYVNRPTTGAIVLRQPFGGLGKSAFGPGAKAGGPNYLIPLMSLSERAGASPPPQRAGASPPPEPPLPAHPQPQARPAPHLSSLRAALNRISPESLLTTADVAHLTAAIDSYAHWMNAEFGQSHDHFRLVGEDNVRRYLPLGRLWIRLHDEDAARDVFARAAAARAAGCRTVVSAPPDLAPPARRWFDLLDALTDDWAAAIEFIEQTDEQLVDAMRTGAVDRVRYAHPDRVPLAIRRAAAESFIYVADAPPLACGRVELLWYVQEQSVSHVYHRYGNLGRRADEPRAPVS